MNTNDSKIVNTQTLETEEKKTEIIQKKTSSMIPQNAGIVTERIVVKNMKNSMVDFERADESYLG